MIYMTYWTYNQVYNLTRYDTQIFNKKCIVAYVISKNQSLHYIAVK